MKKLFWVILFFQIQVVVAQQADTTGKSRRDSIRTLRNANSIGINFAEERDKKIQSFADSIENYQGGKLPNFMLDLCLDWKASLWPGMHDATSVRWLILSRVVNKNALKRLLANNDSRLKLHCSHQTDHVYPYLAVPMIKYSFYELIKKRYDELR